LAEATIDTPPVTADETVEPWAPWKRRLDAARKRRDDKVALWQENVEKRNPTGTSTKGTTVNKDAPLTKAKIAQLYSQTPEVRLTPRVEPAQAQIAAFGRKLNDVITDSSVGTAIEEVLADVVNAAGIGGVLVSCEKRTEMRQVPEIDPAMLPPEMQQAAMAGAIEIPMIDAEVVTDYQYPVQRLSPTDLLVPSDFTGSNYQQCRWLAYDGRMTWAQALVSFGLTEEQKEDVLTTDKRASDTNNTLNQDSQKFRDTEVVNFTEVYYWRHFYHQEETSFKAIQRVVFVKGLDEPVIDEEYTGQRRMDDGSMVGVTKLPILVCTLTYISDESLPPSDSSISRHQVDELEESRGSMVDQRKHSRPMRWGDTNRISPGTKSKIDKGEWQDFIWTNGPGERALGEVARASFPPENFEFDRVINTDIQEQWQVGTNQAGAFASGERSASEARIIQQNFATRIGQERDKVSRFFIGIAECLAGLIVLHGQEGFPEEIAGQLTYSIHVDSTVLLDAKQQIDDIKEFVNMWGQSGFINPKFLASKHAELLGWKPEDVVVAPTPKPPEPVKMSVSNAVDLRDPFFIAYTMATGQAPTPEQVAAAIKLSDALATMMPPPIDQSSTEETGGPVEVAAPGIRNPDWQEQPRINKRDQDGGA
jgi:hypothetical protein